LVDDAAAGLAARLRRLPIGRGRYHPNAILNTSRAGKPRQAATLQ